MVWPATTAALVGPTSLNLLTGEEHERVKRQLSVAVGPAALQTYVPLLQRDITDAADDWVAAGERGVELLPACKLLAFATFGGCLLGLPGYRAQGNVNAMVHSVVHASTVNSQQPTVEACMVKRGQQDTLATGFNTPPLNWPGLPYAKALAARADLVDQVNTVLDAWDDCAADCTGAEHQPPGIVRAAQGVGDLPRSVVLDNAVAMLFGNVSAGPTLAKARLLLMLLQDWHILEHVHVLSLGKGIKRKKRHHTHEITLAHHTRKQHTQVLQYVSAPHRGRVVEELRAAGCVGPGGRLQALSLQALAACPYIEALALELLRVAPAVPVVFRCVYKVLLLHKKLHL